MWFLRFSFIPLLFIHTVECNLTLKIDALTQFNDLQRFWDSTGFCPPAPRSDIGHFLFSKDVKLNTLLISSLPNKAIKYIRIHWLLDLITIRYINKNGRPVYDYSHLESFLDWLHDLELYSNFEIMGNPSSYFNNFENPEQKHHWELFIRELVFRSLVRYKLRNVNKWRFESWNEPDLDGYNVLNFTLTGFSEYIEATKSGLLAAAKHFNHTGFTFGGPAGLFKRVDKHPICWGALENCNKTNKCAFDYISFHKKGNETTDGVLNGGLELAENIQEKYSNLRNMKFANDEADLLSGWSKSKMWRADARYAGMVVKVIIDYYEYFIHKNKLQLLVLSNDNAFLNYHPHYFTQRTLLARFQMNHTNPPHIQFIKKPVYVGMALLSYLGDKVLQVATEGNETSLVSALATSNADRDEFAVIVCFVDGTRANANISRKVAIHVRELPRAEYKYVVYVVDNVATNPASTWRHRGRPVYPDAQTRSRMRRTEGPRRLFEPADLYGMDLKVSVDLTLPSVALLHVCSMEHFGLPGPVTKLRAVNITHNEVLLAWKDTFVGTRCVRTYEIEFRPDLIGGEIADQLFRRVNTDDVIFLSHQHVATDGGSVRGWYRVRAVDYWLRKGPYSHAIRYGPIHYG